VIRSLSLGVSLFVLWLLLSGHFEPLLIILGIVSCVLVVVIAHRMDVIDHEGHPIGLTPRILLYWPWLLWEIVKANIDVIRRLIDPKLPISPTIVRVKATQKTELGRVIYANSITLTPGTVTIDVEGHELVVHALSREGAEALETGEMDRRVTSFEGVGERA
jgi:multicomponent Na+:H+ antiporter subunit E